LASACEGLAVLALIQKRHQTNFSKTTLQPNQLLDQI